MRTAWVNSPVADPPRVAFEIGCDKTQKGKAILNSLETIDIACGGFIVSIRRKLNAVLATGDLPSDCQRQVIPPSLC